MIHRFWQSITSPIGLLVIGFASFVALLLIASTIFELPRVWVIIILAAALAFAGTLWYLRRNEIRQASANLAAMLTRQAAGSATTNATQQHESEAIRQGMLEAIRTIKNSKLGQLSGDAALYELPWYMIIGSPAAGKSTAITNSGLTFPFADTKIVQGVGGTRNCDWFFTTEGIVIDTAGRYSVEEEDRAEWFSFLDLLKKYRKRAPINGIIIAVNIDELTHKRPEFAIDLAKNLRQRVQELTLRLEVHAPTYVMFTKADLIAGFNEFFQDAESGERDRIWGATLPYSMSNTRQDVLALFDKHFEELYDGLKELSLANMGHQRRERMPSGVFTFPLEFNTHKDALRTFIATLFEENPFQFKPVFRGFYFTSARQEGETVSASSQRVAQRFNLNAKTHATGDSFSQKGYFLLNLFRNVIFADKDLVVQYASVRKTRLRYITFIAAASLTGLALGGWYWSSLNNRQLVTNVQADLDKVIKLQEKRFDLESRFEALEIIQDRIEQLNQFRTDRPLELGLGLYQGEYLERKLREEYFSGLKEVMLIPVTRTLEAFLKEVNTGADKLQPMGNPPQSNTVSTTAPSTPAAARNSTAQFKDVSPDNVEDAYNALKTYLMLGDKTRAEPSHLNDQLSRFWRVWLESNRSTMPREKMIRSAERMITFYLSQINDPFWQPVENNRTLVEQSRINLKRVVSGMPARERVYADIKARAATRFKGMTVAGIVGEADKELILGSYAIPGTFTREAWEKYVQNAFKEAANKAQQSEDWVLKTSAANDLTLEGSPEQIQKALIELYTTEYIKEWQKFMQGVSIKDLNDFDSAASAMNHLGDPQISPINKLIATVYQETSWDSPSLLDAGLQQAQRGLLAWFKENILRQAPVQVPLNLGTGTGNDSATRVDIKTGPIGREFAGVARLMISKDKGASLMRGYLDTLSKLRVRFNQIKNQGDIGPGTKQFMQQTLDGTGSELADALKYVDEQMLTGMTDKQKQTIRPLLVRPLIQIFAVIVKPTEAEINKVWVAQVLEPFQRTLAAKSPFTPESGVEATNAEIASVFGPEGTVAKFFNASIGPLVVQRGNALSARTWADMGISLAPSVITNFPGWIAPLSAGGVAITPAAEPQTKFDLQALSAIGANEFTIEIDGQKSTWRGRPEPSTQMSSPNGQAVPGVRITAILPGGRSLVIFEDISQNRLSQMGEVAKRKDAGNGIFELSWSKDGVSVSANLKMNQTQVAPTAAQPSQGFKNMKLPGVIVGAATPPGAGLSTPTQTTGATP